MNDAHLHLAVNHFPIIGTILGLGILIAGIILKNNSVKNTAYCLFIVAAIFAALYFTGTVEGTVGIVLLVLGGVFLATSAISFCPLYTLVGLNTCPTKK